MGLFDMFGNNQKNIMEICKTKRTLFYTLSKRFFDLGLLREVYSTDTVSVCNLANSMYLAFPFATIEDNNVCGLVIDTEGLKKVIKDNNYVYKIATSYQKSPKYIVPLNDKFVEVFLPIKEKRSAPGFESSNVDLKFEEELMKKRND